MYCRHTCASGRWQVGREKGIVTECAFELSTHVIETRNLNLTLGYTYSNPFTDRTTRRTEKDNTASIATLFGDE